MDPLYGGDVYAAEKILKTRVRKGRIEYLIKWKGWPNSHNTWEPPDNVLNKNLFIESGLPVPAGFKGKGTRGARRSVRRRKRKIRDSSAESYQSEEEVDEENESTCEKDSASRSGTPAPTGTISRPGPSHQETYDQDMSKDILKSVIKSKQRVSKPRKKKTPEASPVPNEEKEKKEAVDVVDLVGGENKANVGDEKIKKKNAQRKKKKICADTEKTSDKKEEESHMEGQKNNVENTIANTTSNEEDLKKDVMQAKVPEEDKVIAKAVAFNGRSGTVQVISNGQEQMINRLAFVVDNTPGLLKTTEQLQIHTYESTAQNPETKVVCAENLRNESFHYNGAHEVTEVTFNGETVTIVEF